ncbi:hypothetical protein PIB30_076244, partial [Stylosanthes scabra]|nr:hypothetical protein [Stylosanthes scabra]
MYVKPKALYPYWESMGWGFSFRIFQTFQVQVQAWKVAKYVVDRRGLDSPDIRFTSQSRVSVVPQYRPNASAAYYNLRFLLERATGAAFVPPIIHVVPKIACEKPSIAATAIFLSGHYRSLLAVVSIVMQPPSSTPGMCILHFVTHLLMVYPNPNPRNPHLPQPRSPQPLPPTAGVGAWKSHLRPHCS